MGAITSAVIAVVGVILGWITIELACKPCLETGRQAIDRSLNPDYDPDDDTVRQPLNPNTNTTVDVDPSTADAAAAPSAVKSV